MNAYRTSFGFGSSMTPVVKNLLIANVAVFMIQTLLRGGMSGYLGPVGQWLAFIPRDAIFGLEIWRFFTYMFLHGGMFHLLFNMFALWMFGSSIEEAWGAREFLKYYFFTGIMAGLMSVLVSIGQNVITIGGCFRSLRASLPMRSSVPALRTGLRP